MQKDKITLNRIAKAHPAVRDELSRIYSEAHAALTGGAQLRFSWVLRSFAEQQALYEQGRAIPGDTFTDASAGLSYHNYGLAVDIVLLIDNDGNGTHESASWDTAKDFDKDGLADWAEVVKIFKRFGWEWGGDWKKKDRPHFQKTFGFKCSELLAMHKSGQVDEHGYVIIGGGKC